MGGKYSQAGQPGGKYNRVQLVWCTLAKPSRRAREGPGTSSYTFVPSHALKACHCHLLRSSSHLCRRPPAAALALLGKWCTHAYCDRADGCLSDPGLPDPDERQPGADRACGSCKRNDGGRRLERCSLQSPHSPQPFSGERQQQGLCHNFLSRAHATR